MIPVAHTLIFGPDLVGADFFYILDNLICLGYTVLSQIKFFIWLCSLKKWRSYLVGESLSLVRTESP